MRTSYRRTYGGNVPSCEFSACTITTTARPSAANRTSTNGRSFGSSGYGPTSIARTTFLVATSTSFTRRRSASPTEPEMASSLPSGEKSMLPRSWGNRKGRPMRVRVRVSSRRTVPLNPPAARILSSGLSASVATPEKAPCITPIAAGRRTSADSR